MRRRLRCLLIGAWVLAVTACASQRLLVDLNPEPDGYAWWLRTEFQPRGTAIRGIPVRELDPRWCKANAVTAESFPESIRQAQFSSLDGFLAYGDAAFSSSGTFGSGERLEVILGIYETCQRQRGNFFVVLAPDRVSAPDRIVQVEQLAAMPPVFLILRPAHVDHAFAIVSCFQCDDPGIRYKWDAAAGKFKETSPPPLEPL